MWPSVREKLGRWAADLRWAGDWKTLRALRRSKPGLLRLSVRLRGRRIPITVRGGTMDLAIARQILCRHSEYRLPIRVDARVIFDIGANIGMTTLYYAAVFPRAHIYCFEPLPQNLELLRINTAPIADRVTIIPKGLGDADGLFDYHPSNDPANFGGGTFHGVGCDGDRALRLPVTTLAAVCERYGIDRVDILKIDAEGAEFAVLQGAPAGLLERTAAVIGELHGVDDFAFLDRLSKTHRVAFNKPLDRGCYPFLAVCRRAVIDAPATLRAAA